MKRAASPRLNPRAELSRGFTAGDAPGWRGWEAALRSTAREGLRKLRLAFSPGLRARTGPPFALARPAPFRATPFACGDDWDEQ